jgi:protein-L-isoaspartate(D-aspartate) O-methyltransferase
LQLTGTESVLEIGTGSGYFSALLARRSKHVTTLEIDAALAEQAAANLRAAVVANVDVKVQDGSKSVHIQGDFDVIVLSGSVAQIPTDLTARLKMGGRLAAIVGSEPVMRFTLVTRTTAGLVSIQPWDTLAPRLSGFPELAGFNF